MEERICRSFFSGKPLRASILRIYTGIDPIDRNIVAVRRKQDGSLFCRAGGWM